jgi:hypothetical protein
MKKFFKISFFFSFFKFPQNFKTSAKINQIFEILALIFLKIILSFINPIKNKTLKTFFIEKKILLKLFTKQIFLLIYYVILIFCINLILLIIKLKDFLLIISYISIPLLCFIFAIHELQNDIVPNSNTIYLFPTLTQTFQFFFSFVFNSELPNTILNFLLNNIFLILLISFFPFFYWITMLMLSPFSNIEENSLFENILLILLQIYEKDFFEDFNDGIIPEISEIIIDYQELKKFTSLWLIYIYLFFSQPLYITDFHFRETFNYLPKRQTFSEQNPYLSYYLPAELGSNLGEGEISEDEEEFWTFLDFTLNTKIKNYLDFTIIDSGDNNFNFYNAFFYPFQADSEATEIVDEDDPFAAGFSVLYEYFQPYFFHYHTQLLPYFPIISLFFFIICFLFICSNLFITFYQTILSKNFLTLYTYNIYRPYIDQYIYSWYRMINFQTTKNLFQPTTTTHSKYLDFFLFFPQSGILQNQQSIFEKLFHDYIKLPTNYTYIYDTSFGAQATVINPILKTLPQKLFSITHLLLLIFIYNEFLSDNPIFMSSWTTNIYMLLWPIHPNYYLTQYPWLFQTKQLSTLIHFFDWPLWTQISQQQQIIPLFQIF